MIEFSANGGTASGYLAVPASGRGPGIAVIQEYWGLVPHIEDVCDRFAAEGFTALAADLYHGETTREPDEAGKMMMALRVDRARADMGGAVSRLLNGGEATGGAVGTVGFCMGGGLALLLACDRPEVRACVTYYGVIPWEGVEARFERSRAAILGHWGDHDDMNPAEKVNALEQRIAAAGRPVEFHWYAGGQHAWFNDTRPEVYHAEAAQLSWRRTTAFLRRELGS